MLPESFLRCISKFALISKGERIVAGVSGGPDSAALLCLLAGIARQHELTVHVAHLDHGLRPASSRDAEFTRALAKKFGLPCTVSKAPAGRMRAKGSLEENARKARQDFLFGLAERIGASSVALGHTLDDQAETVLMRLLRGAGLSGLAGIMPRKRFGAIEVIRPLIETRRREIEAYLKRKKIRPCNDETNAQDLYLRNRIRLGLIPLLEREYNPNIKEVLAHNAESIAADYDYILGQAEKAAGRLGKKIRIRDFNRLHRAMQRLVLRVNIARLKGDTRRITFRHLREIEDLVCSRPSRSIVDLPQGVSVVKKGEFLNFYRRNK